MKTVIEMLENIVADVKEMVDYGDSRFTGCVHTSEVNIECLTQELQMRGYWVEYRRIGGSDNYVIKIEW